VEERERTGPKLPGSRATSALSVPHVFEGKYFSRRKLGAAETALATDIYRAFFYRGLARLPATKTHSAWDYDYACVVACDATEKGMLSQAWDGLQARPGSTESTTLVRVPQRR
jgi:hypothetical protein